MKTHGTCRFFFILGLFLDGLSVLANLFVTKPISNLVQRLKTTQCDNEFDKFIFDEI